eukprot:266850-Chlamydomonas_euryale.AAC.1
MGWAASPGSKRGWDSQWPVSPPGSTLTPAAPHLRGGRRRTCALWCASRRSTRACGTSWTSCGACPAFPLSGRWPPAARARCACCAGGRPA